jgi:hypothetical protein
MDSNKIFSCVYIFVHTDVHPNPSFDVHRPTYSSADMVCVSMHVRRLVPDYLPSQLAAAAAIVIVVVDIRVLYSLDDLGLVERPQVLSRSTGWDIKVLCCRPPAIQVATVTSINSHYLSFMRHQFVSVERLPLSLECKRH